MENLCGVCFQPAELFQVPGYTIPSCIKCSEQLAIKGLTSGIYANPPRPDVLSHSLSQVTATTVPTQPTQATGTAAAVTATMNGTNVPQQQQSQQQSHLDQNQKKTENFCDCTGRHSSSCCLQNLLKLPFDLEQTLQNIDNELLFGDEGSCPICSKTFGRKSSLLNHIRNHSAEKKYICTFCQKGFTQAANLRNHERIHTNERPFVCIDCGKAFTQVTNLNNHRRLHTGERPFVCIEPDCGRSFAQVTNLNNHMKTHHKIQQYVCNQCPRRFTQVSQLNQHLTTHTGVRGFVCPQCPDKSFKQQSHLQQHLKTHGLDFPYACARCDEKFVQFVHLEHHMKMHEEFRFKCNMCASSFNQEVLLKKHIQRHIDGRYLTCPIEGCNEGFTIKHHLTRHMQQHHSINSNPKRISVKRSAVSGKHNCYFESCDESFGDPESLNEHLRNVHGLSIVKNVGKRSKMDLMLLEQMKNNANNTNNKNMENAGGPVQHFMQNFAINDQNIQPQQLTSSAQSAADSSKRILSVTEMINMTDEQMRKQAERKAQLELDMQVECPNSSIACSQQRINDVTSMRTGIIKSEPERGTINIMRLVCNICFNMFKTPVTLARHIQKFHT